MGHIRLEEPQARMMRPHNWPGPMPGPIPAVIAVCPCHLPGMHSLAPKVFNLCIGSRARSRAAKQERNSSFASLRHLAVWAGSPDLMLHVWPRLDSLAMMAVSTIHVVDRLRHVDASLFAAEAIEFVHPWMRLEAATWIQTACQKGLQAHGI